MSLYEKKYKEALGWIQSLYNGLHGKTKEEAERYFPELKESEDEKMVKFIKNQLFNIKKTITENYELDAKLTKAIDWLEKQGEKDKLIKELGKYKVKYTQEVLSQQLEKQGETFTKKDVDDAYLKGISDAKNEIEKQYEANYQIRKDIATFIFSYRGDIKDRAKWMDYLGIKVSFVEKQGEQKSDDKVEAKQKPDIEKGKWYVCTTALYKDFVVGKAYYCPKNGMLKPDENEMARYVVRNCFRPWNIIQDVKDGDVLSFNDGHGNDSIELIKSITEKKIEFWFCLTNSNRYEVFDGITPYTNLVSRKNAIPATKEERDMFFQKMKEAGYEWSDKDRKLIKIVK